MKRWLFLLGIVTFSLVFSSCYTVLMVAETPDHRIVSDYDEYEEYYDEADSLDTENTIIHEHYIYGDLWPGYVVYDPFWTSPYGYYYHSAWPYWVDNFYFWGDYPWSYYGGGFYSVYSPGYYYPYWNYRDPYFTYWSGYYSPTPYQRRPFAHRDALRGSGNQMIGNEAGSVPATDRRLGKGQSNTGNSSRPPSMTGTSRRGTGNTQTGTSGSSRRVKRSSGGKSSTQGATRSTSGSSRRTSPKRSSTSTRVQRPSSSGSSSGRSHSGSSGSSRSSGSSGSSSSGKGSSKRR